MRARMQGDSAAIDALTGAFFDAFTTQEQRVPHIDSLYELFLPGALIVKNVGGEGQVLNVADFVEPRRALLTSGSLEHFVEWETSQRTDIAGNVAHRFSRYQKYWTAGGKPYGGTGVKTLQYVRIADGWKISALAWDDLMAIRPLQPGDIERIREIDSASFAPDDQYGDAMYEMMSESPESLVAVEDGNVIGYAFVQRNAGEGDLRIRSLAVHPEYRRRGYAQALIGTVVKRSPGSVDLLVEESNTRALALYTRLGFIAAEMRESVPGRRRMRFRMRE